MTDSRTDVRPDAWWAVAAAGASPVPAGRRAGRSHRLTAVLMAALLCGGLTAAPAQARADAGTAPASAVATRSPNRGGSKVLPTLRHDLVAHYDFDHPVPGDPARERDLGFSGTAIDLVNGGSSMRVRDDTAPGNGHVLQTRQVDPATAGSDDWKAGVYSETGVGTLHAFNAAKGATIMGWFNMTGSNPSPNSGTTDPADRYNAVGLAGVLTGTSQGHDVRALLEVINVSGELRVVALGRRVDGAGSQTFAASDAWQSVLPQNTWVFLAATFDFDDGTMRLYKDGRPLDGFYVLSGDPWGVAGEPEPDLTSATDPRGIKIGGSYPQNTREANPCNCRMDDLMFLDRVVSPWEVRLQYHLAAKRP